MCTYFKIKTDVAQNLYYDFFSNFDCQRTTEALYADLTKAEAATSSYSAAGDFLQYIYSVIMAKSHQKI